MAGMLPPIAAELTANISEASAKFKEYRAEAKAAAEGAEKDVEASGSKLKSSFSSLAGIGKAAILGIAGAAVAIGAEGVKSATEYQESTAKIAANTGVSQAAADQLGDAFLKTMGKSTFSAQQIAQAFGPVSGQLKTLNGTALTSSQAMTVMQAAMDAAEASGQDLGTTTSDLASVMQAYHLGVGQASSASNVLFNVSKTLNLPIDQVSTGMDKLKGRLGNLAPSMTDTATLMEALGTHGITGTRGVSVVTSALGTLLGGSKDVGTELSTLGVHVTDAAGNFVGMQSVIQQLQPALAGMGTAQQEVALKTLFGSDAAQVMNQIIAGGVPAYQAATDAVSQQGSAQEAAEKQAKTWQGTLKTAKSAVEDLEVSIGEKLLPVLARGVGLVTSMVEWFTKHKAAAIALGLVVGGVLVAAIGAFTVSLFTAEGALSFLIGPIGLVILAVAALGVGIYELVTHWKEVWGDVKQIADDAWHALDGDVFQPIGNFFVTVWRGFIDTAKSVWDTAWSVIRQAPEDAWHVVDGDVLQPIASFFKGVWSATIGTAKSEWHDFWSGVQQVVQTVWGIVKPIFDDIKQGVADVTGGISKITGAVSGIEQGAGAVLKHLPHFAGGGVVSSPTLALVGEAGPEAIVPLSGNGGGVSSLPGGSSSGSGGVTAQPVNVQINGQTIISFLLQYQRSGGVVAITRNGIPLGA